MPCWPAPAVRLARRGALAVASLLALLLLLLPAGAGARAEQAHLLVTFQPGIGDATAQQTLQAAGAQVLEHLGPLPIYAVTADAGTDTQQVQAALAANPTVRGVDPDDTQVARLMPNDALYKPFQWNLRRIGMENAWDLRPSAADVVVAVLDTGVDLTHPDLAANLLADQGYDFIDDTPLAQDDESHGTAVAGIIGAVGNNGQGIAGVAWRVKILPVKTLDNQGRGPDSATVKGIEWAIGHGAQVINISSTGSQFSTALQTAVQYAQSQGALVVAAAGNNGDTGNDPSYPAAFGGVLAVAAIDDHDQVPSFSQRGSYVTLAAPGVDVPSTSWIGAGRGPYASQSGTSIAAPHVSGAAALLWSLRPDLAASDIASALTSTADQPAVPQPPEAVGAGVLDVAKALAAIRPGVPPTDPNAAALKAPASATAPTPPPQPAPLPTTATRWYFAEGSTKTPFQVSFAVQNPNPRPVTAHFAFLLPDGTQRTQDLAVPASARGTLKVNDVLPDSDFGTIVSSDSEIFVERSMYFGHDGHSAPGVRAPAQTWYLAEGSTAPGFDTWVLLMNPGSKPATVTLHFMREMGDVVDHTEVVPPTGRVSVYANLLLPPGGFSTQVNSDQPIVVERSMYFDNGQGGHVGMGISTPSRTWYVAEGASEGGLDTWLLVDNPGAVPANTTVTFMTSSGVAATQPLLVPPHARVSLYTNLVLPNANYGLKIDSDQPVVAERALYAAGGKAGLDSPAVATPAAEWFLPEGETDGSFVEQLTLLNPQTAAASVEVDFQRSDGSSTPPLVLSVGPRSNLTVDLNPYAPDATFSLHVFADRPILAERTSFFATPSGQGASGSTGQTRV